MVSEIIWLKRICIFNAIDPSKTSLHPDCKTKSRQPSRQVKNRNEGRRIKTRFGAHSNEFRLSMPDS